MPGWPPPGIQPPKQVLGRHLQSHKGAPLHPLDVRTRRIIAMVYVSIEHPSRVTKRQFGDVRNRYRGLAKNRAKLFTLFASSILFLVRRRPMA